MLDKPGAIILTPTAVIFLRLTCDALGNRGAGGGICC